MVLPAAQPAWEQAERERLDASRCGECRALPPNHLHGCTEIKVPDLDAERCPRCPYPAGSLGCRITCGSEAHRA